MYLKKKGTVLISAAIILALMTTLGYLMFEMIRNNNEISSVYDFDKDIYDFDDGEEEILYKGMDEANKKYRENQLKDEDSIFSKDFDIDIENNTLSYKADKDKFFLTTKNQNERVRKREIAYSFMKDKIILIPTYKFINDDE